MKSELLQLPVEWTGQAESGAVTALHAQADGSLLCGLAFARPAVLRLRVGADGRSWTEALDLKVEEILGDKEIYGVVNGLRSNTSGDTAFGVLQGGFLPGFLRPLAGGDLRAKGGRELTRFLAKQDGGLGAALRHTVLQIVENEVRVRRYKEPGAILDVAHIGDYVFGLTGGSIWREPYLNSEKREVLRNDLRGNLGFHRDDNGTFWLLGQSGRLLRLGQTDIKAKPTPLKMPGLGGEVSETAFRSSAASSVDDWLYGVNQEGDQIFRVRRNPVSMEEEIQNVAKLPNKVCAMIVLDEEGAEAVPSPSPSPMASPKAADAKKQKGLRVVEEPKGGEELPPTTVEDVRARRPQRLIVAVAKASGVELQIADLKPEADPEMLGTPPALRSLGEVAGLQAGTAITVDASGALWLGEGSLGSGRTGNDRPRLARVTGY